MKIILLYYSVVRIICYTLSLGIYYPTGLLAQQDSLQVSRKNRCYSGYCIRNNMLTGASGSPLQRTFSYYNSGSSQLFDDIYTLLNAGEVTLATYFFALQGYLQVALSLIWFKTMYYEQRQHVD